MSSVPTALRVNGTTNGLSVDGRPPLLSPSQVSLGPQSQGYRAADLGDSPGEYFTLKHLCHTKMSFSSACSVFFIDIIVFVCF